MSTLGTKAAASNMYFVYERPFCSALSATKRMISQNVKITKVLIQKVSKLKGSRSEFRLKNVSVAAINKEYKYTYGKVK